jgi:hypothetical protein
MVKVFTPHNPLLCSANLPSKKVDVKGFQKKRKNIGLNPVRTLQPLHSNTRNQKRPKNFYTKNHRENFPVHPFERGLIFLYEKWLPV